MAHPQAGPKEAGGGSLSEAETKRPWFQIHLSTCIVLMITASICVGVWVLVGKIQPPADQLDDAHVIQAHRAVKRVGQYIAGIGTLFGVVFTVYFEWSIRRRERKQQEAKG